MVVCEADEVEVVALEETGHLGEPLAGDPVEVAAGVVGLLMDDPQTALQMYLPTVAMVVGANPVVIQAVATAGAAAPTTREEVGVTEAVDPIIRRVAKGCSSKLTDA